MESLTPSPQIDISDWKLGANMTSVVRRPKRRRPHPKYCAAGNGA
jgi:hypothetical protein